jgi:hypothetical protein
MGTAKFYYYPKPSQTAYLQTIDLAEPLAELFSDYEIDAQDGVSYTGRRYRTVSRISEIVRIQRDRMIAGEEKARDLITLQSHLDRGYSTMFAADSDKAYATHLRQPARAGDTVIFVASNIFRSIVGNKIVAAGDYLMIESENPNMRYQMAEVESITATASAGGTITLTEPIQFDFASGTIGVRHYRFWPSLKRPVENLGSNMVTNERGFLWSLDVTMTPDYPEMFSYYIPVGEELGDLSDAFADGSSESPLGISGQIYVGDAAGMQSFGSDLSIMTEPTLNIPRK